MHYIIRVQLQKGLIFVVVDWDYKQWTSDYGYNKYYYILKKKGVYLTLVVCI